MLIYFAATLFVSAALLFLVQPMVGKMILPRLGGTPAVWNTCMVFFQGVLLVGYAYTHTLSTWQSRSRQLIAQLVVLMLPFLVLPFTLGNWQPPEESNPVFAILWLLLGMVGLPFFVVATSAPLLQKWFASTGHPAGKDPYFLYGASNLGSMLALLLYPLVVEPLFDVGAFDHINNVDHIGEQAWLWTGGYVILVLLVLGCMAMVYRVQPMPTLLAVASEETPASHASVAATELSTAIKPGRKGRRYLGGGQPVPVAAKPVGKASLQESPVTWARRLRWVGLAAVPSSLMLGVTTHLTTDIAAIPFFWVLPLALYLLTFILVFSRWPVLWTGLPHLIVLYAQPFLLMALVVIVVGKLALPFQWMEFVLHVLVFFVTTLLCHGEMAKDRPATSHLTEFYLWMSVGGVLGGMFNALLAPLYFKMGVIEYPMAMVLACLLRPMVLNGPVFIPGDSDADAPTALGWVLDFVLPIGVGLATLGLWYLAKAEMISAFQELIGKAMLAVVILAFSGRPIRFGLSLAIFATLIGVKEFRIVEKVFEDRSFFGFVRVRKDWINERVSDEGYRQVYFNALIHGGINHGWQALDPNQRRDPITYFHPSGGIGQIFQEWRDPRLPVSLVGLGALHAPLPLLAPYWDPGYSKFDWPDARLPASLAGMGASPLDLWGTLLDTQSEPPYAVVGLGIGTLAAHAKPFQHLTFFEIDPIIKRLSLPDDDDEEPIFHYLNDALERGSNVEVIMGDGRLSLQKAPQHYYHILVLDAFSSDAIPVHLLTREAVKLYLDKLTEGGLLVFNTTNRYVDINGVLADVAHDLDLDCYAYGDYGDDSLPTKFGSDWIVMRRKNVGAGGKAYSGGPPIPKRVPTQRISGRTTWQKLGPTLPKEKNHVPLLVLGAMIFAGAGMLYVRHLQGLISITGVVLVMAGVVLLPFALFALISQSGGGQVWTDRYSNLLGVLRW